MCALVFPSAHAYKVIKEKKRLIVVQNMKIKNIHILSPKAKDAHCIFKFLLNFLCYIHTKNISQSTNFKCANNEIVVSRFEEAHIQTHTWKSASYGNDQHDPRSRLTLTIYSSLRKICNIPFIKMITNRIKKH